MRPEHWLFTIPLRLRSLFRRAQADQQLDDELRDHLERKTEEYVAQGMAQGMAQAEAHRRARLDLGGIEQTKEKCRDARRVNWIQDLIQDIRYGLRILRKSSGFTAVAVLTLALGIGATTAIFSVVDAVLLRSLPYRDPQRLVSFFEDLSKVGYPRIRVSPPTYLDLKAQTRVFEDVAAVNETGFNFSRGTSGATQLSGALVTYNLFAVLGAEPLIGTTFLPEEDRPGANHV